MPYRFKTVVSAIALLLTTTPAQAVHTAYDFSFDALMEDEPIMLSDFKGKVVLIVNTASKCGFTKQYAGLESLYQKYKERGLVVIGVPSNDFGQQEQGSGADIAKFCEINYGVSFPMTAKYNVRGDQAHPFYTWAKTELGFGTAPKWNFHKYLLNKEGELVDYFHTFTKPKSKKISKAIEKIL